MSEGSGYNTVVAYEPPIKVGKTKETLELLTVGRGGPASDSLDLTRVGA